MNLAELVGAIQHSPLASYVRGATPGGEWAFPIIETIHVLCLAVVFGSISFIDLRLVGVGSRKMSFSSIYRDLVPWTWWAFAGAAVSGTILATGKIEDYMKSPQFFLKFTLMALAGINMLVFHFGAFRNVSSWDNAAHVPLKPRLAGALSLLLWIGVVFCGRWVGFVT